jgi:hypothetical protein
MNTDFLSILSLAVIGGLVLFRVMISFKDSLQVRAVNTKGKKWILLVVIGGVVLMAGILGVKNLWSSSDQKVESLFQDPNYWSKWTGFRNNEVTKFFDVIDYEHKAIYGDWKKVSRRNYSVFEVGDGFKMDKLIYIAEYFNDSTMKVTYSEKEGNNNPGGARYYFNEEGKVRRIETTWDYLHKYEFDESGRFVGWTAFVDGKMERWSRADYGEDRDYVVSTFNKEGAMVDEVLYRCNPKGLVTDVEVKEVEIEKSLFTNEEREVLKLNEVIDVEYQGEIRISNHRYPDQGNKSILEKTGLGRELILSDPSWKVGEGSEVISADLLYDEKRNWILRVEKVNDRAESLEFRQIEYEDGTVSGFSTFEEVQNIEL